VIDQRFLVICLSAVECANIYIIHHYDSTGDPSTTTHSKKLHMQAQSIGGREHDKGSAVDTLQSEKKMCFHWNMIIILKLYIADIENAVSPAFYIYILLGFNQICNHFRVVLYMLSFCVYFMDLI